MPALAEISIYLLRSIAMLYTTLVIVRFLLQVARADFYNPISQFIVKATTPPLKPLRRIIPSVFGLDTASLVLALAIQFVLILLILLIVGGPIVPAKLFTWALINTISLIVNFYFFSIIVGIILSWVAPQSYHPAAILVMQINEPVMAPFRKLMPDMGGIDISPIFVFMSIKVIKILLGHMAVSSGMLAMVAGI